MTILPIAVFAAIALLMIAWPIIVRLTMPGAWRPDPDAEAAPKAPLVIPSGFQPIDLGPDPLHWPSARPWSHAPVPDPPWPSETWNDPQFGPGARRKKTMDAPVPVAPVKGNVEPPARPAAVEAVQRAAASAASAAAQIQDARQKVERSAARSAPSPQQVEAWLGELGLAGTIEQIRQHTGWEFKDVVAFLQQRRRGR